MKEIMKFHSRVPNPPGDSFGFRVPGVEYPEPQPGIIITEEIMRDPRFLEALDDMCRRHGWGEYACQCEEDEDDA